MSEVVVDAILLQFGTPMVTLRCACKMLQHRPEFDTCLPQGEGHYYVMVHHVWDPVRHRDVMKMWKLGGAGSHQTFELQCKHDIDWDRGNYGFTFPMGKKTVPT